jgi:hypothetical protein
MRSDHSCGDRCDVQRLRFGIDTLKLVCSRSMRISDLSSFFAAPENERGTASPTSLACYVHAARIGSIFPRRWTLLTSTVFPRSG